MKRRLKAAWDRAHKGTVVAVAAIAAIAGVAGNLEKIVAFWDRNVSPALAQKVEVAVTFDAPGDRAIRFGLDPRGDGRYQAVHEMAGGQTQRLSLAGGASHKFFWEGAYFLPAAGEMLVGSKPMTWRLQIAGQEGDRDVLVLREVATGRTASRSAVSAATLIAASAGSGARDFKARALSMMGLYETGSTDCSETLKISDYAIAYGCFDVGPGPLLGEMLADAERATPGVVDQVMGPRASDLRVLGRPVPGDAEFARRLLDLTRTSGFRQAYGAFVDRLISKSDGLARNLGLESQRGRLFVLDRVVNQGAGPVAALAEAARGDPSYSGLGEERKILLLAEMSKARLSHFVPAAIQKALGKRIDLFATGKGEVGGVTYDLDALGFTLG